MLLLKARDFVWLTFTKDYSKDYSLNEGQCLLIRLVLFVQSFLKGMASKTNRLTSIRGPLSCVLTIQRTYSTTFGRLVTV